MHDTSHPYRHERIDHDYREPSPSTGYRDVFAVMGATPGLGDPEPSSTPDARHRAAGGDSPTTDAGADVLEVSS